MRFKLFNNSCLNRDNPVDNTYLWFINSSAPQWSLFSACLHDCFEFICAQAPRTTQGLLIGLWYATFSIRYLLVDLLDALLIE